jgi:hypothetical protein
MHCWTRDGKMCRIWLPYVFSCDLGGSVECYVLDETAFLGLWIYGLHILLDAWTVHVFALKFAGIVVAGKGVAFRRDVRLHETPPKSLPRGAARIEAPHHELCVLFATFPEFFAQDWTRTVSDPDPSFNVGCSTYRQSIEDFSRLRRRAACP